MGEMEMVGVAAEGGVDHHPNGKKLLYVSLCN